MLLVHREVLHDHVVAHSAPLVEILEVVKHVTGVLIRDSVDLQSISIMKKQAFSDLSNLCKLKMVVDCDGVLLSLVLTGRGAP